MHYLKQSLGCTSMLKTSGSYRLGRFKNVDTITARDERTDRHTVWRLDSTSFAQLAIRTCCKIEQYPIWCM